MYIGGNASNLDVSCEQAAEADVRDLIHKYDVHVEDFTAGEKTCLVLVLNYINSRE